MSDEVTLSAYITAAFLEMNSSINVSRLFPIYHAVNCKLLDGKKSRYKQPITSTENKEERKKFVYFIVHLTIFCKQV